ncbi:Aste57867_10042 [Aphanomyces stellatus]|uniref:Aste57867_10042 protein n=1 Tax=Aphanomyces stellatus TaxID=120398 RepID=A0A485KPT9_9STRA|nr:hypothetical protein As57867_010003 [Aphanomyces stellatus]VFT86919.1 Aste57867_10042 [Aphanomyces stellatus]
MSNYEKWDRILKELEDDEAAEASRGDEVPAKMSKFPPLSHKPLQLKQEIHDVSEKLHALEKDLAEFESLSEVLKELPTKLNHDIMVPLGKQAFIPGKIIHANEILAHLGGEHYAKKTASETAAMVDRKTKNIVEQIKHQEEWLKSLNNKLGDVDHVLQLKKIYEDADIQEINETEDESNELVHASDFTQEDYDNYFEIEREEAQKSATSAWDWDEAMRRIEELEQHEDGKSSEDTMAIKANEADGIKQQGNAAFASKNYTSAVELYTKALTLTPNSHTLLGNRSAARYHLQKLVEAKDDAEAALSIEPTWAKGHFRLGQALAAMGQFDGAAAAFEEAAKLKPSDKSSTALAAEMRQKADNEKRLQKLSIRDQERSNVFSGTVVERESAAAPTAESTEPPKRVSRFKAMRQGQL